MSDEKTLAPQPALPPEAAQKSAQQKLAELVARRKADAAEAAAGRGGLAGRRQLERDAAARSAARSKPAMRK